MLKSDTILVWFSLGFGPADVRNSLAQEPDHERIIALDLERISGEKLRHPVRHDLLELLSGDRLNIRSCSNGSSRSSRSNREKNR